MTNLTIEQIEQVLSDAPEGATHHELCGYYKFSIKGWEFHNLGLTWIKTKVPPTDIYSLSDLETILSQHKEIEQLKLHVKRLHKQKQKRVFINTTRG